MECFTVQSSKRPRAEKAQPSVECAHSGSIDLIPPTAIQTAPVDGRQAAKMLGVAVKTLTNWRSLGLGPLYIKYGGRQGPVRYRVADLATWQAAQVRKPRSDGGSRG